jgi:Pentapeptide repeats (8 copies)
MLKETLWWPWSERKKAAEAYAGELGSPPKPEESKPDTKDVEALAASLNHAAERVQTLWLSFLTFTLYLAIAAGTTTHRMLFREDPLTLPVLNIPLPLIGFYVLAPIIFVVFHFYMLLNLVLLARTAKAFDDALELAPLKDDARENFRMRIENTLFVQLLVGGRKERGGFNSLLLRVMALISLAIAPVALLVFMQVRFLPYHSEWLTWTHRSLLIIDLALVCTLWPGYRSGWGVRLFPRTVWAFGLLLVFSAAALFYATVAANFPDEGIFVATKSLREQLHLAKAARQSGAQTEDASDAGGGLRDLVYGSLWPPKNTLDVHRENLIDDARLKLIGEREDKNRGWWEPTLGLDQRNLIEANLTGADIRHVDFTGANLQRANLEQAWAEKAHFTCVNTAHVTDCAQLQGASLDGARLQGASLDWARLQGASLDGARLQGASLDGARLQGASFDGAQLQGALAENASVWRGDARTANAEKALIVSPDTNKSFGCLQWVLSSGKPRCEEPVQSFDKLRQSLADSIPEGERRDQALARIDERLKPESFSAEGPIAEKWSNLAGHPPTAASILDDWGEIGCEPEGAPYVVRALLGRLRNTLFADEAAAKAKLAQAFLESTCDGARGLADEEITKLKAIANPAAKAQNAPGSSTCAAAGGCQK